LGIEGARDVVEVEMFKPWTWSRSSNDRAICNARASATELGRRRVERHDVELFLARHREPAAAARRLA